MTPRSTAVPIRKFFITSNPAGGVQQREFSISPDGRRVVLVSARKLYIRDLDQLRLRELKGAGETGLGESGPFSVLVFRRAVDRLIERLRSDTRRCTCPIRTSDGRFGLVAM